MSSPELNTMPRSLEVALMLTEELLSEPEQLLLFEDHDSSNAQAKEIMRNFTDQLKKDNEGKIIIHSSKLYDYRYKAAMYGAGLHPTQLEAISYEPTNESGTYVGAIFKFDYENLQACRDLDFDLLYERKD